jgi:spermidine synthase
VKRRQNKGSRDGGGLWICLGLAVLVGACAGSRAKPLARVVHAEDSSVGRVYVVDEGDSRFLRFERPDGDDQSVISKKNPAAVPMDYVRVALAAMAHADRVDRLLMLGLGAGTFTTAAHRALPGISIDAVELSPVVVRIAREFFGLPDAPDYRIHLADGWAFLGRSEASWDVIFLDVYVEETTPDLMLSRQAYSLVKRRLSAGGAVIVNLAVEGEEEDRSLTALAAVFGRLTCYETEDGQNLLVAGRADGRALSSSQLASGALRLASAGEWGFELERLAGKGFECP